MNSDLARNLTKLLLTVSTAGFVSMIAVFISQSPIFLFYATDIGASQTQTLVPLFLFLVPFSMSLVLTIRGKLGGLVVIWIGLLLAASFVFAVPLTTVQRYSVQCNGTYTEWQSLGFRLFAVGLHTEGIFCEA